MAHKPHGAQPRDVEDHADAQRLAGLVQPCFLHRMLAYASPTQYERDPRSDIPSKPAHEVGNEKRTSWANSIYLELFTGQARPVNKPPACVKDAFASRHLGLL